MPVSPGWSSGCTRLLSSYPASEGARATISAPASKPLQRSRELRHPARKAGV